MIKKKYQIFISSTFLDLIEERKMAIDAIMQLKQIPVGMELFGSMGEEQFSYIKEKIRESDYYLLIIGGKYGTLNANGISYTEAEYDFAVLLGIRVIAFLYEDMENLPAKFFEQDKSKLKKLMAFRKKVSKNRLVAFWNDPNDLRSKILSSLASVIFEYPTRGWVREITDEDEKFLFPELSNIDIGKYDINYSDNPSYAIVRTNDAYVQLEARAGNIESYMINACIEFLKLTDYNSKYLNNEEIFCIRKMWFNTTSPEVIIYLDFLYDMSFGCHRTKDEIKDLFYSNEILGDGICYSIIVRFKEAIFSSDYFYKNDKSYYSKNNSIDSVIIDWEHSIFEKSILNDNKTIVTSEIKITNQNDSDIQFNITATFRAIDDTIFDGIESYTSLDAYAIHEGKEVFFLKAHESKKIACEFRSQNIIDLYSYIPKNIRFLECVSDDDYE